MATGMSWHKVVPYKIRFSNFKIVFRTIFLSLLFSEISRAANIQISWAANGSSQVAGYKIYQGTVSHDYTKSVKVSKTSTSTTFTGLTSGTTYYFAATSYDSAGNQSAYSDEIVFMAGAASFSSITRSANQFSFAVQGSSGKKYVVLASTDLRNWTAVKTNTAPFQFAATNTGAYQQQFFRTRLAD